MTKKATIVISWEDVKAEIEHMDLTGEEKRLLEYRKENIMNWIDHKLWDYISGCSDECVKEAINQFKIDEDKEHEKSKEVKDGC